LDIVVPVFLQAKCPSNSIRTLKDDNVLVCEDTMLQ